MPERGHPVRIDSGKPGGRIEPGQQAPAKQAAIGHHRAHEMRVVSQLVTTDALAVHVCGKADVAQCRELVGAAAHRGVESTPFMGQQHARRALRQPGGPRYIPFEDSRAIRVLDQRSFQRQFPGVHSMLLSSRQHAAGWERCIERLGRQVLASSEIEGRGIVWQASEVLGKRRWPVARIVARRLGQAPSPAPDLMRLIAIARQRVALAALHGLDAELQSLQVHQLLGAKAKVPLEPAVQLAPVDGGQAGDFLHLPSLAQQRMRRPDRRQFRRRPDSRHALQQPRVQLAGNPRRRSGGAQVGAERVGRAIPKVSGQGI